ncbi:MAG: T9SS type A sorting domain-containing protein [bacterium]
MVWYDERDSSKVWARKVGFDGSLIGFNFPIRPDSTGSILGLEAQNHPDGRVLVSWVVGGMYSRARWLDAEGQLLGEVFDVADPPEYYLLARSSIDFAESGTGLLYQYSGEVPFGNIYITSLDNQAIQIDSSQFAGYWARLTSDGGYRMTFPSFIYLGGEQFITVQWKYYWIEYSGHFYEFYINYLFQSNPEFSVTIDPVGTDYKLTQLNDSTFIYSISTGSIYIRAFRTSGLDSLGASTPLIEPDIFTPECKSDIAVQNNGSFRITYSQNKYHTPVEYYNFYTKSFTAEGVVSGQEEVISFNENLDIVNAAEGTIHAIESGGYFLTWLGDSTIYGTTYENNIWTGDITAYDLDPVPNLGHVVEIDNTNHVMLGWYNKYANPDPFSSLPTRNRYQIQCFEQLYSACSNRFSIFSAFPQSFFGGNVALRDNGNFIVFLKDEMVIVYYLGTNYDTLEGISYEYDYWGDPEHGPPVAEASPAGYWMLWATWDDVYTTWNLLEIDSDGDPIGDPQPILCWQTDDIVNPEKLAVSESGNFAVVWAEAYFDDGDIFCRQFNPDGSLYGNIYQVNSDPVGPLQKEPAVAFGPNDQLYFTWTDFRNEGNQGDIYCKVIEWIDATAVEPEPDPVPLTFALHPPYPNPFNPTTTLTFTLPVASEVSLQVFNVHGQNVLSGSGAIPTTGYYSPGTHTIQFDGSNLASGIYFVRLQAGEFTAMQKLVLLK